MSCARWYVTLYASLLVSCDDGVLRAFEPRGSAAGSGQAGGAGGAGAEAAGGRAGTTPLEPTSGSGAGEPTSGSGPEDPSAQWLIDDFEDGDPRAKEPRGWWYRVNDGTGTQGYGFEPISGGMPSVYALRTHGSGFHDWGAAIGVNLVGDASALSAPSTAKLCFQARVEPGTITLVHVHFVSDQHYIHDVSLSEAWSRYCLSLVDFLAADGAALVPNDMIALQYFFAPDSRFEMWLDDVEIEP